jgi:hypothetical protein
MRTYGEVIAAFERVIELDPQTRPSGPMHSLSAKGSKADGVDSSRSRHLSATVWKLSNDNDAAMRDPPDPSPDQYSGARGPS